MRRRRLQGHRRRRSCRRKVGGGDQAPAAAPLPLRRLAESSERRGHEGRPDGGLLPDVRRPGLIPRGYQAHPGRKSQYSRLPKSHVGLHVEGFRVGCRPREMTGIPAGKWTSKLALSVKTEQVQSTVKQKNRQRPAPLPCGPHTASRNLLLGVRIAFAASAAGFVYPQSKRKRTSNHQIRRQGRSPRRARRARRRGWGSARASDRRRRRSGSGGRRRTGASRRRPAPRPPRPRREGNRLDSPHANQPSRPRRISSILGYESLASKIGSWLIRSSSALVWRSTG